MNKENYKHDIRLYHLAKWWHRFIPKWFLPYFVHYTEFKNAYPVMVGEHEDSPNAVEEVNVTFRYSDSDN